MQAESQSGNDTQSRELEKRKYERIWEVAEYTKTSPAYHRFFDHVLGVIRPGDRVIEFGCGTGYGLAEIAKTHEVLGIDIADNCLQVDVPFMQACLWEPINASGDVGFCIDVMEHIPTDKVGDTFYQIMQCVPRCLFIPCLLDDHLGYKHIGEALHLTVKPAEWWRDMAEKYGKVTWLGEDVRAAYFIIER